MGAPRQDENDQLEGDVQGGVGGLAGCADHLECPPRRPCSRPPMVGHPLGQSCQLALWHNVFGRDLLVLVLHLLSNPSCRREVGASWTDGAVTLVSGIGGPSAELAGLVAHPLPLGETARVVAQLGCDRGLHQRVFSRSRLSEVSLSLSMRLCSHTPPISHRGLIIYT